VSGDDRLACCGKLPVRSVRRSTRLGLDSIGLGFTGALDADGWVANGSIKSSALGAVVVVVDRMSGVDMPPKRSTRFVSVGSTASNPKLVFASDEGASIEWDTFSRSAPG